MLIIKPDFCSRICGKTALITSIGPKKLVSKLFRISSVGVSSIGPVIPTPALLMITSILLEMEITLAIAC